ncbi:UNVERIFIED_CONTAM: hypothetical protein K2H54_065723, partial [Gekko kuhli]
MSPTSGPPNGNSPRRPGEKKLVEEKRPATEKGQPAEVVSSKMEEMAVVSCIAAAGLWWYALVAVQWPGLPQEPRVSTVTVQQPRAGELALAGKEMLQPGYHVGWVSSSTGKAKHSKKQVSHRRCPTHMVPWAGTSSFPANDNSPALGCCTVTVAPLTASAVHPFTTVGLSSPTSLFSITGLLGEFLLGSLVVKGILRSSSASSSSSMKCVETQDNTAQMPLFSFGSTSIEIKAFDSSADPVSTNTFQLRDEDIPYVPLTPNILNLTADFSTRTLNLAWNDGSSTVPFPMDATWEIQILYKDPMETVALETYHSRLTGEKDNILHWSWTSVIPLECTSHYAQIRSYHHLEDFTGTMSWSEWSPLAKIPGKDTGKLYDIEVFPKEYVVQVGSNLTFCCVWKKGQRVVEFQFGYFPPELSPPIRLSNWSSLIHVPNVNKSMAGGTNAWCITNPHGIDGSVAFIGYPPDIPQDLNCETSNFKEITCDWKVGRQTNLYSRDRKTYYSLFDSISGKSVTYTGKDYIEHYHCDFPVLDDQRTYNFTVRGSNPIGQAESSILIDINYRVRPQTPTALTVIDSSATHIILSWHLSGNLTAIMLRCLVQINSSEAVESL